MHKLLINPGRKIDLILPRFKTKEETHVSVE